MKILLPILMLITACSQDSKTKIVVEEISPELVRTLDASELRIDSPTGANVVDEAIQVQFGTILNTESKTLSAKIRNMSTAGERILSASRVASPDNYFTQTQNSCSNIAPKSTCDIRMIFNGKISPQNSGGAFGGTWVLTFSDGSTKNVRMNIQVEVPVEPTQEEIDVQKAAQMLNIEFSPAGSLDLGEMTDKQSKVVSLVIRNNNLTSVNFPTSVQAPFVLTQGCSIIPSKSQCTARISINGAGREGLQSSVLSYGTKSIPVSAFVKSTSQVLSETILIENITESSSSLDFGSLKPSDNISRSVEFTNRSNKPINFPTNLSNNNFIILSNTCNNAQVAVNSRCTVRISLSGAGKTAGLMTGTLTYGTTGLVNLSANVLSEEEIRQQQLLESQQNSNIVMSYLMTDYTPAQNLDLGIKNQGIKETLIFNLKNIGTAPASVSAVSFASNLTILSNNCITTLNPKTSCQVRTSLNPQSSAPLDMSVDLGFETRIFPIAMQYLASGSILACDTTNAEVNGINMTGVVAVSGNVPNCVVSACNETTHSLIGPNQKRCGEVSYQPNYSSYGTCSATACEIAGTQTRTYTCSKLVDGSNPTLVDNINCSSLVSDLSISCASPEGDVVNPITGGTQTFTCLEGSSAQIFKSVSCSVSGYEANGQICSAVSYEPVYSSNYTGCLTTEACTGQSIEAAALESCQKSLDGQPVSGGQLSDCSSFDQSISRTCSSPAGNLLVPIDNGSKTVSCESGSTIQTYVSNSLVCTNNSIADEQSQQCLSEIVCSTENADEYGVQLFFVETVSGIAPNCVVSSCKAGLEVAADMKSCKSKSFSFAPQRGFNGPIYAIAKQQDGKVVYGGTFSAFIDSSGVVYPTGRIARINVDGTLDVNFANNSGEGFNQVVSAIKLDSLGNIYVGGSFSTFKGETAPRIAKLTTSGLLDSAFMSAIGIGFSGPVNSIALDSSNNIYVGGNFTSFKGVTNSARYIAKLNSAGVLDTGFMNNLDVAPSTKATTSSFNSVVNTLALDSSNNIYVGGNFTSFKGVANTTRFAKLTSAGLLDTTFMAGVGTGFNSVVNTLAIDSSNNIYVGGNFTSFKGVTNTTRFAKLTPAGLLDSTFMTGVGTGFDATVQTIKVDSSNNVYVGGLFTTFKGLANTNINRFAKLTPAGLLDTTFMDNLDVVSGNRDIRSGFNNGAGVPYSGVVAIEIDGSNLFIGGTFTSLKNQSANSVVKINSSGNRLAYTPSSSGFDQGPASIEFDSQGNTYMGGNFNYYNGILVPRIAKFDSEGNLDTDFANSVGTGFDLQVKDIAIDTQDNIYVVGQFSRFNSTTPNARSIAKLTPSGTLNTLFETNIGTGFDTTVNSIALDSSNNVYVGGRFTSFKGVENSARYIAKFNSDGVLDPVFMDNLDVVPGQKTSTSGFDDYVVTLAIDSSNNVYVGGIFSSFKGVPNSARYIAKLNSDGEIDTGFMNNLDVVPGQKTSTSGFDDYVFTLAIDSSNNIYVGGSFTSFKGVVNNARGIAKLNSAGVLDTGFMNNLDVVPGQKTTTSGFEFVRVIKVDVLGNVYVGGDFTSFKGVENSARYIAKFNSDGVLDPVFMDNLDVVPGQKTSTSGFSSFITSLGLTYLGNVYVGGPTMFKDKWIGRIINLTNEGIEE